MKEIKNSQGFIPGLISIVVPVYNSEQYLPLCVESILNQTYKNIEIMLIDDGSTDSSGEICDNYALNDNRFNVIHVKNNGPSNARNIGIERSKGSFIFFLDSDDYIENNALTLLMMGYEKHNADLIVGDFNKINNDGSVFAQGNVFPEDKLLSKQNVVDYARNYLKKPNRFALFAYSWGRLFKSSIIKKNNLCFNVNLHTFEDVAFNFDYLMYTNGVFFLKEVVYNHLAHNNYASATMNICGNPNKLFGFRQALTHIGNFLDNCNSNADIKKELGYAEVCLTIIQLVRICGQINSSNRREVYQLVREIVNELDFRKKLQFYSPSKGDSRVLPILMKLKLVWLVVMVCKYKANKRYKKKV